MGSTTRSLRSSTTITSASAPGASVPLRGKRPKIRAALAEKTRTTSASEIRPARTPCVMRTGRIVAMPGNPERPVHASRLSSLRKAPWSEPMVTLLLAERLGKGSPYARVLPVVLGTLIRLAVGFGGGAVMFFASGATFRADPLSYWFWVLGAYLVTLVVETVLLARGGGREPGEQ